MKSTGGCLDGKSCKSKVKTGCLGFMAGVTRKTIKKKPLVKIKNTGKSGDRGDGHH